MTHVLKPYPARKDSGLEWLGEVPEHWEIRRLKNVAEMRISNIDKHTKESEYPVRLCNYVDVYKNDHISPSMLFMRATATADEIARFRLTPGDVLITKDSEAWDDIGVPALVVESADDLVSGYHLALLRPLGTCLNGGYLLRALQSRSIRCQFHVQANGVTRYGLSHAAIQSVWLPLPPLPEQAAIVRLLDYVDRRIQRYIRAKEKLIALLKEQKQAIIHQAVTGKINARTSQPYPAYKDSGVEWLGEVPEHWDVRRVGGFSKVGNGSTPSRGNPAYWSGGEYPWLNSSSVNQGIVTRTDQSVTGTALRECHLPRVPADSVLLGITGQGKTRGMAAILAFEATINQHVAYISPDTAQVSSKYLCMCLSAAYTELRRISSASGSTKCALTCEDIKSFRVALSPIDEQELLLSSLTRELVSVDRNIERARCQADLLREYHTRLIADVVTGKLDVSDAATALPKVDPLAGGDMDDPSDTDVDSALENLESRTEVII